MKLSYETRETNDEIRRFGVIMTPLSRKSISLSSKNITPPSNVLVDSRVYDQRQPQSSSKETDDTVRVILLFKISVVTVRKQLKDLSLKEHTTIQPVLVSWKIERELNVKETKPSVDNFTVVCSVTWTLNGSETGGDLVLIQTALLLSCKSSCKSD